MVIREIILKVNLFWDLCMQTIGNIPKNPEHVDNFPKRPENPDCNVPPYGYIGELPPPPPPRIVSSRGIFLNKVSTSKDDIKRLLCKPGLTRTVLLP